MTIQALLTQYNSNMSTLTSFSSLPDTSTLLLLIITGFVAGVCNAIAGGGTFFTLPVFLSLGLPPIVANASNAVAVWPGHIIASWGYRDLLSERRSSLYPSLLIGLIGAVIGVGLLASVGNQRFRVMIPFLILIATVLFAVGGRIHAWLYHHSEVAQPRAIGTWLLQLIIAIYGGFFSAGLGVMLMAMLMVIGVHQMQLNNAYKNAIASVISTVAVGLFIVNGWVVWQLALPAFVAGIVGGMCGTYWAKRLPAIYLKTLVVLTGLGLSVYYFTQFV